jgi:hypothetical protein
MTHSQKTQINTYVPITFALVIGYYLYTKKNKPEQIGVAMVFTALVSWVIVGSITKQVMLNEAANNIGNVGSISNYDPTDLINKLHEDIYCIICIRDMKLYDELLGLADQNLITLAKEYYKKYGVGIGQDIADEISTIGFLDPFDGVKIMCAKRFKTLNIF